MATPTRSSQGWVLVLLAVVVGLCVPRAWAEPPESNDSRDRRIDKILSERRISLWQKEVPLSQIIDDLQWYCEEIDIVWDNAALEEAGIHKEQRLTACSTNLSLRSTLFMVLRDAGLTFIIQDGRIVITTAEGARGKPFVMAYPVADLVVPQPGRESVVRALDGPRWGGLQDWIAPPRVTPALADSSQSLQGLLARRMMHTIEPESWSDVGGKGTLQFCPLTGTLVVNQSPEVQEQVASLLRNVRQMQRLHVTLDVRVASVNESCIQSLDLDFANTPFDGNKLFGLVMGNDLAQFNIPPFANTPTRTWSGHEVPPKLVVLGGDDLASLLARIHTHRGASMARIPALIVANGLTATVPAGPEGCTSAGKVLLTPLVSEDRRAVRLSVDPTFLDSEAPAGTIGPATVDVPDGSTLVMGGFQTPAAGRGERAGEMRQLLVLVTVRIVIQEEAEVEFSGQLQRIPR